MSPVDKNKKKLLDHNIKSPLTLSSSSAQVRRSTLTFFLTGNEADVM